MNLTIDFQDKKLAILFYYECESYLYDDKYIEI